MRCPYCNNPLQENSNTCAYCGKDLQTKKAHLTFYPSSQTQENDSLKNSLSQAAKNIPKPTYQLKNKEQPNALQQKETVPVTKGLPQEQAVTQVPNRPAPTQAPVLSRPVDPSVSAQSAAYQAPVYKAPKTARVAYVPPVSDASPALASPSYKMDGKSSAIFPQSESAAAEVIPTYPDLLEDAPIETSTPAKSSVSEVNINQPVEQIQLQEDLEELQTTASTIQQTTLEDAKEAPTQKEPLQANEKSTALAQKEDYLEEIETKQPPVPEQPPKEQPPSMTPSELDEPLFVQTPERTKIDQATLANLDVEEELNELIYKEEHKVNKKPLANKTITNEGNKVIQYDSFADSSNTTKNKKSASNTASQSSDFGAEEDFPTAAYPVLNKVMYMNSGDIVEKDEVKLVREPIQDYSEEYHPHSKPEPIDPFQYDSLNASDVLEKPDEKPVGNAPQALSYQENSFVYDQLHPTKQPIFKNKSIMIITAVIVCIVTLALVITFAFSNRNSGSSLNITGNEISGSMNVKRPLTTYSDRVLTAENFIITIKSVELFTPAATEADNRERIIFTYEMTNTGKAPITPANPLATRFKVSEMVNNNYVNVESTELPNIEEFQSYKNSSTESLPVETSKTFKKSYIINPGVTSVKLTAYDEYSAIIASESFDVGDIPKIS